LTQSVIVRVTRRAANHIAQAADWWEVNRPDAPGAVRDELEEAVAILGAQPEIGAVAFGVRVKGVRRVHLSRIHYFLYYRVQPGRIDVLALWHTSRGATPHL
jgi:plasmid stabilization system protein ParE